MSSYENAPFSSDVACAGVAEAVTNLPEREQFVIGLYYQEKLTLREIGEVLGVTESRVCPIHTQAVARLRGAVQRQLCV